MTLLHRLRVMYLNIELKYFKENTWLYFLLDENIHCKNFFDLIQEGTATRRMRQRESLLKI
jgi:hypothetical protein